MKFIKRFFLFGLINLLVVLSISCLLAIFRVGPYLNAYGLNINNLAIFCLMWGFIGAFISLALSKILAKWLMGVHIIEKDTSDPNLLLILNTVKKISLDSGLEYVPEVGIYSSPEVNAFATGPTKKRSLIAVSSGLLNAMNQDELEGVLGHEISHIINGDMVTLTLMQGVVNAFVMFLARILAFAISNSGRNKNERSLRPNYFLVYFFEIIFMILGSIVIAFFSRKREFRADESSAKFLGKEKMLKALVKLKSTYEIKDLKKEHLAFQTFKISNSSKRGLVNLFSTHPCLDDRIEKLKNL